MRKMAGLNKAAPDEFAVLTKGSLVIPPDFGLMPPKPGSAPTNQTDPVTSAEGALFGSDAATANLPANVSAGEKSLLANAGAAAANPQIRQDIAADNKAMLAADDSFTNDILFWQEKKKDNGKPVDADAEAKRLKDGQPAKPEDEKDSGGWFDGWFDWF